LNTQTETQYNPAKGFAYALAGTLAVSTNFVTAKYGTKGFDPATFSLVWTASAAFYCLTVLAVSGRLKDLVIPRRSALMIVLLGASTGVGMLAQWAALKRLDPSFAAFLGRFAPVLAILLGAVVLRERLGALELCALGLMVVGGVISTVGRWHVVGLGTVLMLIGCTASAVQMLLAKMQSSKMHPDALVFYRVAGGTCFIAVWVFGTGAAQFHVPPRYWVVTLVGAFLGPFTSFLLTFRAYRSWELSRAAVVRTAEPLFVLPMAYVAFGTLPAGRELVGGLLILVGALWIAWIHFIRRKAR
jgi:drug/metabolite transporter (DMT)-like permease